MGDPPFPARSKNSQIFRAKREKFFWVHFCARSAKNPRVKRPNTPKVGDPPLKKIRAFLYALKRPRGDPPNLGPVSMYGSKPYRKVTAKQFSLC